MATGRRGLVEYNQSSIDDWPRWVEDLCRGFYPDNQERIWEFYEPKTADSDGNEALFPLNFTEPAENSTDDSGEAYRQHRELSEVVAEIDEIADRHGM